MLFPGMKTIGAMLAFTPAVTATVWDDLKALNLTSSGDGSAGAIAGTAAVVDSLYVNLLADNTVAHYFNTTTMADTDTTKTNNLIYLKKKQKEFLTFAFGKPGAALSLYYTVGAAQKGNMYLAHNTINANKPPSLAQWNAVAGGLIAAMNSNGINATNAASPVYDGILATALAVKDAVTGYLLKPAFDGTSGSIFAVPSVGESGVALIVQKLYERIHADTTTTGLKALFPAAGTAAMSTLQGHLTKFVSVAVGCGMDLKHPAYLGTAAATFKQKLDHCGYTGRDMWLAHKDLAITQAQWGAVAGHLGDAVKTDVLPAIGITATATKDAVFNAIVTALTTVQLGESASFHHKVAPDSLYKKIGASRQYANYNDAHTSAVALSAVVDALYVKILADTDTELVACFTNHQAGTAKLTTLKAHQVKFLREALGWYNEKNKGSRTAPDSPSTGTTADAEMYSGRDLSTSHATIQNGGRVTATAFDKVATHAVAVLTDLAVHPDLKTEIVAVLVSTKSAITEDPPASKALSTGPSTLVLVATTAAILSGFVMLM